MVEVPAAIPVTAPEEEPTVAFAVLELLQVPPATPLLKVTELAGDVIQIGELPVMEVGAGRTVTAQFKVV